MKTSWGLSSLLTLIAVICFALDVIGLDVKISLIALGLAFGFAAFLVGNRGIRVP